MTASPPYICLDPTGLAPVRPHPDAFCLQRYTSQDQAEAMLKGAACPTCGTGLPAIGDALCLRCIAEVERERLAEIDELAHRACLDVLPSLYEPDDFLAELAGLPEIARVLRGGGAGR